MKPEAGMITDDGLHVYDLDPTSSTLWAVAGPSSPPDPFDPDDMPPGFRWVDEDEWSRLVNKAEQWRRSHLKRARETAAEYKAQS